MAVTGTLDLVHSRQALYHRVALPAPGEEAGMGTCDHFPVSVWGMHYNLLGLLCVVCCALYPPPSKLVVLFSIS